MLVAEAIRHAHAGGPAILSGVSLVLRPGEVVGLRGASGSGKTTLGKILSGHLAPCAGTVRLDDAALPSSGFCPVQMLFQTPELAVNPRWRIGRILEEAYLPSVAERAEFGIRDTWLRRYPHEISGGELQRVAVLRALAPGVRYLVADEISAALDPLTQAALWHALLRRVRDRRLGILAISHNHALLARIATRICRMENGRLQPAPEPIPLDPRPERVDLLCVE